MAKAAKKKFELLGAVWQNATEQLEAGSILTFENDEPTGIFVGRVRELVEGGKVIEVASPAAAEEQAPEAEPEAPAEPEAAPPAPPAPKK